MTSFDQAFALSKANMSNIDLGHYVAGTGESPIPFLRKFHDRIASVHLKDRTTPAHGAKNLPWGTGDTPLHEILQVMKRESYTFPASIELEYDVPEGSDAVKEVATCLAFCNRRSPERAIRCARRARTRPDARLPRRGASARLCNRLHLGR